MLELAAGVINVLEKRVLSLLDQERMLKAPDKKSAFDVLFDTDLADFANNQLDLEAILALDLKTTQDVLQKILPENQAFFNFLFLKFDSFNLKLCLKSLLGKGDSNSCSINYALELYDNLFVAVKKNKADIIKNEAVSSMVKHILKQMGKLMLEEKPSSRQIETMVDKAYFKTKIELAKTIKNPFLLSLTKIEIDIANLKRLLKKRNHNFIEGGNLKEEEIKNLSNLKEGEIVQDLNRFLEVYGLSLIIEKAKNNPFYIENALQGFFSKEIFAKERDNGFGYEKVLSFFHKKLNAQNNIRIIMFGKENNIEIEKISPCLLPI